MWEGRAARETSPAAERQTWQLGETQTWRTWGGYGHLLSPMAAAPQNRPGRVVPRTSKTAAIQAQLSSEEELQNLRVRAVVGGLQTS